MEYVVRRWRKRQALWDKVKNSIILIPFLQQWIGGESREGTSLPWEQCASGTMMEKLPLMQRLHCPNKKKLHSNVSFSYSNGLTKEAPQWVIAFHISPYNWEPICSSFFRWNKNQRSSCLSELIQSETHLLLRHKFLLAKSSILLKQKIHDGVVHWNKAFCRWVENWVSFQNLPL